jgi:hypothetical protein
MVEALCSTLKGREFETPMWSLNYSNLTNNLAVLGPGVYSVSNRNKYMNQKEMFLGSKEQPARKTDNLTAI